MVVKVWRTLIGKRVPEMQVKCQKVCMSTIICEFWRYYRLGTLWIRYYTINKSTLTNHTKWENHFKYWEGQIYWVENLIGGSVKWEKPYESQDQREWSTWTKALPSCCTSITSWSDTDTYSSLAMMSLIWCVNQICVARSTNEGKVVVCSKTSFAI